LVSVAAGPVAAAPATERIAGPDRYGTAVGIAATAFPDLLTRPDVVIASGAEFPDALAAPALAGALDAPLLLTAPNELSPATRSVLGDGAGRRAHVLGGRAAVSDAVRSQLRALGFTVVETYAGPNRFGTAALIAVVLFPASKVRRPWSSPTGVSTPTHLPSVAWHLPPASRSC
jgi:putative cell wall-binding protein